jgi:type IV secretion system pilin
MIKKIFLAICTPLLFAGMFALFPLQPTTTFAGKCKSEDGLTIVSIKPWYSGVCKEGTDDIEIENIPGDVIIIALNVITIAVQLAGYAAVGLVIWGGIKYIMSNGDSGKISSAKSTIQNALIGLLIVLIAVTIVDFVIKLYE